VNWVLGADIRGFFDAMAHSWIIRLLKHRIADKRILRLIAVRRTYIPKADGSQ
jgi:RNA-directed DNA polymerase